MAALGQSDLPAQWERRCEDTFFISFASPESSFRPGRGHIAPFCSRRKWWPKQPTRTPDDLPRSPAAFCAFRGTLGRMSLLRRLPKGCCLLVTKAIVSPPSMVPPVEGVPSSLPRAWLIHHHVRASFSLPSAPVLGSDRHQMRRRRAFRRDLFDRPWRHIREQRPKFLRHRRMRLHQWALPSLPFDDCTASTVG